MDTLSHALWGRGLFGYRGYKWLAIFFGAMPDLFSFGILIIVRIFSGHYSSVNYTYSGPPSLESIPDWLFFSYNLSHSFIIAFLCIGIVYFFNKSLAFPMLAWPFHILLDVFTHSVEYFPTPIFWPISNYRFDGIPWSNPYIMLTNIICIFLIFIYRRKS